MAKKKKQVKKQVERKESEKKPTGIVSNLASGDWIDKLASGWGKPKEYNKEWNK